MNWNCFRHLAMKELYILNFDLTRIMEAAVNLPSVMTLSRQKGPAPANLTTLGMDLIAEATSSR